MVNAINSSEKYHFLKSISEKKKKRRKINGDAMEKYYMFVRELIYQ